MILLALIPPPALLVVGALSAQVPSRHITIHVRPMI